MQTQEVPAVSRRSSRVPVNVPVLVTSLDPKNDFSEVCETLVVSAHGCAIRSPIKLEAGVPVHFHSQQGRQTKGHIIDCQPLGSNPQDWRLGARLDQPDNFWGLNPCPEDWTQAPAAREAQKVPRSYEAAPEGADRQQAFSGDAVQPLAQLLQPLQAELTEIKDKLARREANQSRFEVSLSQIPPELEEKLWARLRQDLGQRALQLAREESERVLGAAHIAIERKITTTQAALQQRLAEELKAVEQRAQALAGELGEAISDHFRSGLEHFQQQVLDGETRLQAQGEEMLQALNRRLDEEHRAQLQQMQRVQEAIAKDGERLQEQLTDVGNRLTALDQ